MKLTKLVHACLLIEKDDKKLLVDPGVYSWNSGVIKDEHLDEIDIVVVTHAHPDHLNKDFVSAITKASAGAMWYGPKEVVDQLSEWGVNGNTASDNKDVKFVESEHADLSPWFPKQPDHTSYLLFDEVLIGGDCHTLTNGYNARVFGGAISGGPWGAMVGFAKMIENMENRPQKVIPLHDWHWHEEAISGIYQKMPEVMSEFGVEFIPARSAVTVEV